MKKFLEILLYVGVPLAMMVAATVRALGMDFPSDVGVPLCIFFGIGVFLVIGFLIWTV